jgi:hypothetical protein
MRDKLETLSQLLGSPTIDTNAVLGAMEEIALDPGGLAELVSSYAGSDNAAACISLTFVLAEAANNPDADGSVVTSVGLTIGTFRGEPDDALENLFTAVQRLSIHSKLAPWSSSPPPRLVALLLLGLQHKPEVASCVAPVVAVLHRDGVLAAVPAAERQQLREALQAFRGSEDEILQDAWRRVKKFMDG